MRTKLIIIFVLFSSCAAFAGDFLLYVSNDKVNHCGAPITQTDTIGHPVCTAREVSDDILRYFSGKETKIVLFKIIFSNAHIQFCGRNEKLTIEETLISITHLPKIEMESSLYDFSYMLGSRQMLYAIDKELEMSPNEKVIKSLQKLRNSVLRGLVARKQ